MRRINLYFYALAFSTLTVISIMIALLYKVSPLVNSKTLFFCQRFISQKNSLFISAGKNLLTSSMMSETVRLLTNVLILVTATVLMIGILSFLVQLIKTRIFLKKLLVHQVDISSDLTTILVSLNLEKKVNLVKDKNLFSFCYGIFSPFIVISTSLVKSLTDKELEAVLLHEQSHLKGQDPIKVLMGKVFSSMFFFLPVFRELYKNIEVTNELLADQWVINRQQNSTFLRGALRKILAAPQISLATVSNLSSFDYFEIRIHRLTDPEKKHMFKFSKLSLLTSFLFILLSFFLLQTPINAFHMDPAETSVHCHGKTNQTTDYIPRSLYLPEKKCDNH